jgi:hypothetical protein
VKRRVWWDLALGFGALAYVLLALFDGLESPLLAVVVVALTGYQLVQPHRGKRS